MAVAAVARNLKPDEWEELDLSEIEEISEYQRGLDEKVDLCKKQINQLLTNGTLIDLLSGDVWKTISAAVSGDISTIKEVSRNAQELYALMGEEFIQKLLTDPEIRSNISALLNSDAWKNGIEIGLVFKETINIREKAKGMFLYKNARRVISNTKYSCTCMCTTY